MRVPVLRFKYLFEVGVGQRERKREFQAEPALSSEPQTGLDSMIPRSGPEQKPRVRPSTNLYRPHAPGSQFLNKKGHELIKELFWAKITVNHPYVHSSAGTSDLIMLSLATAPNLYSRWAFGDTCLPGGGGAASPLRLSRHCVC